MNKIYFISVFFLSLIIGQDYSLYFDGADDYVNLGRPLSLDSGNAGSFSFWFKSQYSQDDGGGYLITNNTQPINPDFNIILNTDGTIRLLCATNGSGNQDIQTSLTYDDGDPHHVVAIKLGYEGCTQLWVDNQYIDENCNNGSNDDYDYGIDYFIGAERTDGMNGFQGSIDELNVFDKVLSSNEIAELYNFSNDVVDGLVAYYNFNEGNGEAIIDQTGNGNGGTVYGATWVPGFSDILSGCTNPSACNYDSDATTDDSSCEYPEEYYNCDGEPLLFEFEQSTQQAYYFFNTVTIGENNIDPDDWVGAFKGDVCVGSRRWGICNGETCDVPAMGDDGSEYTDGYMLMGDIPTFKIFDASNNIYHNAVNDFSEDADCGGMLCNEEVCEWFNFGFCSLNELMAVQYDQMSIPLHYGNNLISFYLMPENNIVSNVVNSIEDSLLAIIGESTSAQNNNGVWQGSLTTFDTYSGYWFKMTDNSNEIFNLTGALSDPDKIYELHTGVNLISFSTDGSVSITDGIYDDIESEIPFLIGESRAAAQLGGEWVGSLTEFEGGKGYWINTNIDLNFQYNLENLSSLSRKNNDYSSNDEFSFNQSQIQAFYFMNIQELSYLGITHGDWIIAYNDNVIVGSRQWNGNIIDVPVMGYDGNANTIGYCHDNDTPTFKIYSVLNDEFINISFDDIVGFVPNTINHLQKINSSSTENSIPKKLSIVSVYPNPFNPVTTIKFSIPVDTEVSISVYNIMGEEITSLASGNYEAGYYQVIWNADAHSSGVYFVKMTSSDLISTQKLMLVK